MNIYAKLRKTKHAMLKCSAAVLAALVLLSVCISLLGARIVLPTLGVCMFVAIAVVFIIRFIKECKNGSGEIQAALGKEAKKRERKREWFRIILLVTIIKLSTYLIMYVVGIISGNVSGEPISSFAELLCYSGIDAPSYLGIAENWYVTSGDPMYHIVFFPLYPILIRIFYYICGSYFASAIIVSTLCSYGMAIVGYELARIDYDVATSRRFVRYMFILPASFFCSIAMTEALFILLSLLCLYNARKRHFLFAGIFGALAAFSRSPGVLLAVPVGIEFIMSVIDEQKSEKKSRLITKKRIFALICIFGISLGLVAYLAINQSVWGNPFQFSIFQQTHWDQSMGLFPNTIKTITDEFSECLNEINTIGASVWRMKLLLSLWGMELVAIFSALVIVLIGAKRVRNSYIGYFLVYFVFTIGATWLLSAPRYLMALVTLPLILAAYTEDRKRDIAVTALISSVSATYLIFYAATSPIY